MVNCSPVFILISKAVFERFRESKVKIGYPRCFLTFFRIFMYFTEQIF